MASGGPHRGGGGFFRLLPNHGGGAGGGGGGPWPGNPPPDRVGENPWGRDAIYAVLYRTMGRDADVGRLDPFEQCAFVAGLISEAESSPKAATMLLDRAI